MSRIRHRVCHKLHHLQVVDLASSKWNVSIEFLCRAWNMFYFFPFLSGNAYISYRIQALHSSIDQNMGQSEWGIFSEIKFAWTDERRNLHQQQDSGWQFDHEVLFSMLTCYFFYLEIHSLFEDTIVSTEWRRKGHCDGKCNPLSL